MALFTLNSTSKLAGISNQIDKTGAYICKIMSASDHVKYNNQNVALSKCLLLSVQEKEGKTKDVYVCYEYTDKKTGQLVENHAGVLSIMTCTGVIELTPDQNGIFQGLNGKFIGMVFQRKESINKETKLIQVGADYEFCFDYKTRQTPIEKRDNAPAVELDRFLPTMPEVLLLKNPVQPAVNHAMPTMQASSAPPVDDVPFDDDVPF